ncbi:hypothetical protein V5799_027346 [Amblyomma americanum]|uniref:Ubiquitin-conjugating enzyme E2 Z n=1 Tax=Amblyomma americanum TaxID=6943 RepID=A0AAQ4DFZ8_AMBAM
MTEILRKKKLWRPSYPKGRDRVWSQNSPRSAPMATQQAGFGSAEGSSADSLHSHQEDPPRPSLLSVTKDIADFFTDPPPGILISHEEGDVTKIHALIIGPQGTPYEGGFFRLRLKCPGYYPTSPAATLFLTTDAEGVRLNPHIFSGGRICLSILGTMRGPPWSPAQSVSGLLISIQSLLTEDPYYNEPQAVDDVAASRYKTSVLHKTIRAVNIQGKVYVKFQNYGSTKVCKSFELTRKFNDTVYQFTFAAFLPKSNIYNVKVRSVVKLLKTGRHRDYNALTYTYGSDDAPKFRSLMYIDPRKRCMIFIKERTTDRKPREFSFLFV